MSDITVAVVEDDPLVREAYLAFFNRREGFTFLGEAEDGAAALMLYERLRPDVLLMDIRMPRMSGIEATRLICEKHPEACVVALTTFGNRDHIVAALQSGAAGYLIKGSDAATLDRALHAAVAGEMPLSPSVRRALVEVVTTEDSPAPDDGILTPREAEVVGCLADGLSNQEIARRMYLSEGSVKQYLNHISAKLGARSRTQVLVRAMRLGIVRLEDLPPLG